MLAEEETRLGTWQSVDPTDGAAWFSSFDVPWWIAGGWALDLHLGSQSRVHSDLDVGVLRRDIASVRERLASWEMFEAKDGTLTRLQSGAVPRLSVHSLWCRPAGTTRWTLELMLDDSLDDAWVYRREPSIRRPRVRMRRPMTLLRSLLLLLLLACYPAGCATTNCDAEVRAATPSGNEETFADARAKCENRLDNARRALKKEQEQREEQERRDAFRNRNEVRQR